MRKSTILAITGIILTFFIISAFGNKEKIYKKTETFKNPEEAIANFIGYINTYENLKVDNGYYRIPSREFLESISKRYRLYTGSNDSYKFIMEDVPLFYSYELEEVNYDSLTNLKFSYENSFENMSKYKRDEDPKVYKLSGYGGYSYTIERDYVNEDGTVQNINGYEEAPINVYLIVVDEGEGFVVDYYSVIYE